MKSCKNYRVVLALTLLIGSLFFGCSGSGSGGMTASTGTGGGTINGTAVKGPVNGGTVTAYAVTNGTMGAQLANGTTDSQGNYQISIGDYSGPLMLQLSGGTYTEEATGVTTTMLPGDVLTAVIPSVSSGVTISAIQITPITSMAQAMAQNMAGGMTDANISAANAAIGNHFMVSDILHTQPMNPLVQNSANGSTQDQQNYGMALAAMSQYAKNLGMASSSSMVTAMMNDASDGLLNGMTGTTQIAMGGMGGGMMGNGGSMMLFTAGTSSLAAAMQQFMQSNMNKSGPGLDLSAMQALMSNLSSTGQLLPTGGTGGIVTGGTGTAGTMSSGTISGKVVNGRVSDAAVMAFAINNGAVGAQLASGATDSQGNFTLSVGNYSGPVMLQMTGGTYTDSATGAAMMMSSGNVMTAVIPTISTGASVTGVHITPLTSMAQEVAQYKQGGITDTNILSANAAVGGYFMVNEILQTEPVDLLTPGSGSGTTQDMKNYGAAIAAMSQYAKNIGMANSSGLIAAMAEDASDGVMNGMTGSTQITMGGMSGGGMMGSAGIVMQSTAGKSGLANAMSQFMGSTMNKSGLTAADVQALIDQLSSSDGTI